MGDGRSTDTSSADAVKARTVAVSAGVANLGPAEGGEDESDEGTDSPHT